MSFAMAKPPGTISTLALGSASHATAHAHHATHVSGAAIAVGAAGALVVLACLVWALARVLSFEPRWTLSARHAIAEAGFRASATWSEFSDWARLGR
jgi:hypothetical protein